MNKQQKVRDSILKMNQDIYKAKDKYFEKITKVIIQCVNNYSALTWDKGLQEVFELFIWIHLTLFGTGTRAARPAF